MTVYSDLTVNGSSGTGAFIGDQQDQWTVYLTAGLSYTFNLNAMNDYTRMHLSLSSPTGTVLAAGEEGWFLDPAGGNYEKGNGSNSQITYTPSDTGTYTLMAWGEGNYSLAVTRLTDEALDVAMSRSSLAATEGSYFSHTFPSIPFTIAYGDSLSWSVTGVNGSSLPSWLSWDASSGTLSGTAPVGSADVTVVVTVTDPAGEDASTQMTITTEGPPDAIRGDSSTGQSLTAATPLTSQIDSRDDQDWVSAYLLAGVRYVFEQRASSGSGLDSYLRLLNPSGGQLLTDDNGGGGRDSSVTYTPTTTGTYYLSAQGYGSTTGGYTLSMRRVNSAPVVSGTVPSQVATEGSSFSYSLSSSLFTDADGDSLSWNVTQSGGYSLPSWLTWNAAERTLSGTPAVGSADLALTVTASDPSGASASTTFALTTAAPPDAIPGDTTSYTMLTPSTSVSSRIDISNDQDWVRVSLTAGTSYVFDQRADGGSSLDSYLRLLTSYGTQVASNDDGGGGNNARISYTATSTGVYYLSAQGYGSSTGAYTVTMTRANTAPVANATLSNRTVNEGSPFSLTLPTGLFSDPDGDSLTYSLSLTSGGSVPSWLQFNTSTKTLSGTPPVGSENLNLRVNVSDGRGGSAYRDFTLSTQAAPDAIPATTETTATISVNGTGLTGSVDTSGDQDWYRITLTAGAAYTFSMSSSTTLDTYLRLLNSSGIQVAYNDDFGGTRASQFSYTPTTTGTYYLSAQGYGSSTGSYSLSVTAANQAPVLVTALADQTVSENIAFSFTLPSTSFRDPDGSSLTYSAVQANGSALPSWLTFNATTRVFSGTPSSGAPDITVRVTANDGRGGTVSDDFTLFTSDDPGVTLASAYNMGTVTSSGSTYSNRVGGGDAGDMLKFTVSATSTFSFVMNGMTADADFSLLKSDGTVLQASASDGTTADQMTRSLSAGVYYLKVVPATSSVNTPYRVTLKAIPVDNAGNTSATARDFGALLPTGTAVTANDWVGLGDSEDYYKFTLSQTSSLALVMNGMTGEADVTLYNNALTQIASSAVAGSAAETINRSLNAGTYYLKVRSSGTDTSYALRLSATVADAAGNTTAAAKDFGRLAASPVSFSDWVGGSDLDYYKFTAATQTDFSFRLSGMTGNADVTLYSSDGTTVLKSSQTAGIADETFDQRLAAGVYYVKVAPANSTSQTAYSLRVAGRPVDNATGTTLATATDKGTLLTTAIALNDWVGTSDTMDYYKFRVGANASVTLTLADMTSNADLTLYYEDGDVVTSSTLSGTTSETITESLAAGVYYAKVSQSSGDTAYSLRMTATPVDNGPTTYLLAQDTAAWPNARLGMVNRTDNTTVSDFVGRSDTTDTFQFTLNGSGSLTLSLADLGRNANVTVRVLEFDGRVNTSFAATAATTRTISGLASSMPYYLQLVSSGADTAYTASLSLAS